MAFLRRSTKRKRGLHRAFPELIVRSVHRRDDELGAVLDARRAPAAATRRGRATGAIPGKVRSGFPSGIASKQRDRAFHRFRETVKRSENRPVSSSSG
ncbi:MAG: hypothetical protein E5W38_18280 [Mesorhizobium sp.]|nr:MAG: hypothetical protein E5W38_18280 [Mesorhizobium sp.]